MSLERSPQTANNLQWTRGSIFDNSGDPPVPLERQSCLLIKIWIEAVLRLALQGQRAECSGGRQGEHTGAAPQVSWHPSGRL